MSIAVLVGQIFGVVGVASLGFWVIDALFPRGHFLEKIALGYLAGIGIFTFTLFAANLIGVRYEITGGALILALLNLFCFAVYLRRRPELQFSTVYHLRKWSLPKLTILQVFLLGVIGFLFISSLVSGMYWPVKTWDSLALYDFRAQSFISTGFMEDAISRGYFSKYPLLTSLSHTWFYLLGYTSPKIMYFILYVCGSVIFYFSLRRRLSEVFSLFFTVLFAAALPIFNHSQISYTNLPYTLYLSAAYFYLYDWLKSGKTAFAYVSALMASLSIWVRYQEPFWIPLLLAIVVTGLAGKRWIMVIFSIFIAVGIFSSWTVFVNLKLGSANILVNRNLGLLTVILTNIEPWRMKDILAYIWRYIVSPHLILFIIYFLSVPLLQKRHFPEKIAGLIIAADLLMILAGTLVLSVERSSWSQIGNSAERMSMFLIPYILFYVAIVLADEAKTLMINRKKV